MQEKPINRLLPLIGDVIPAAAVSMVAVLAWCAANNKWTARAWNYPTWYLNDPERSDFLGVACNVKAADNWWGLPFFWKTIPELGAPFDGNWNDFPILDELVTGLQLLLAKCFGLFAGINVSFALAHALAATAFYFSARLSKCNRLWSSVGALAFSLAPFIFAQSPHHMQVAYVWPVAFFPLVWRWIATDSDDIAEHQKFYWAVACGFITGLHFIYYTNVFCQLTLIGAAIRSWQTHSLVPLRRAFAIAAAAAVAIALMNVDTWTYRAVFGPNTGAFVREYKWLEIYGLKIKDLIIPPIDHRSDLFSAFSIAHRQAAPLLDERASYLGLTGIAALLWLIGTTVKALVERRERQVPIEAWQILWIVLAFSTGGVNAILGSFGITMFRAACRYSVVILVIALLYATRRLTAWQQEAEATPNPAGKSLSFKATAVMLSGLILWDQVPRSPSVAQMAEIVSKVDADRAFAEKLEASLPKGAMIFQMPVMDYPESPSAGVPSCDHFRPYLFSKNLRYSFGSMKGRDREKWQPVVQAKLFEGASLDQQAGLIRVNQANARAAVDELKRLGFSAIYINRNGFPDRGKGLEEALLELGYTKPPIRNATGDLACIVLEK